MQFLSCSRVTKQQHPITFENKGVGKAITHTFTSKTVDSKQEGFENYAKVGNDVVSKEWTSAKLAAIGSVGKGDVYSPWRIRVNTGRQDYGKNLVLNDFLPNTAELRLSNISQSHW